MKKYIFLFFATALAASCQKPAKHIEYYGKSNQSGMFLDELYARVDSTEYKIDTYEPMCMAITAQEDFNGDGLKDALVTDIQACGGNAEGNSFFFVSYTDAGKFVLSENFGFSVYDDPVIETWEGMPSVVITDTEFDDDGEFNSWQERYILIDTFAVRAVSPSVVTPMPRISYDEWVRLSEKADMDKLTAEEKAKLSDCDIFDDMYSGACSWYCGGEVQSLTASACRKADGDVTYDGAHAHDFDHESVWASAAKGIGESLTYTFAGGCPRITTIKVLNGDVKSDEAWKTSSRVRKLKMYFNDEPYALLALEDSRSLQCFDIGTVGYHQPDAQEWRLRFEVVDIYPGTAHNASCVIAELFFDGIDVH